VLGLHERTFAACHPRMSTTGESIEEFFSKSGPLPPAFDEDRRFPRFYFRTCAEAMIFPINKKQEAPAAPLFVVTSDLSRAGVSIIHVAQLFPGQRLTLILNGQPPRPAEVVWCRKWDQGRYLVGCRFVKGESASELSQRAPE
jgi:PilZ domain-containing protein